MHRRARRFNHRRRSHGGSLRHRHRRTHTVSPILACMYTTGGSLVARICVLYHEQHAFMHMHSCICMHVHTYTHTPNCIYNTCTYRRHTHKHKHKHIFILERAHTHTTRISWQLLAMPGGPDEILPLGGDARATAAPGMHSSSNHLHLLHEFAELSLPTPPLHRESSTLASLGKMVNTRGDHGI